MREGSHSGRVSNGWAYGFQIPFEIWTTCKETGTKPDEQINKHVKIDTMQIGLNISIRTVLFISLVLWFFAFSV